MLTLLTEYKAAIEELRWVMNDKDERWGIVRRARLLLKNFDIRRSMTKDRVSNIVFEIDQAIKHVLGMTDVYDEETGEIFEPVMMID